MPPKGKGKEKDNKAKKDVKGKKEDPNAPPPKPKKIPPPPACFTKEDIVRFKEIFKQYDEEGIEKIPLRFIPDMLRIIGFNPKTAEIKEMFRLFLEDDLVDTVEFHEFLFMIEAKKNWGDDRENDVCKAMEFLAHDTQDRNGNPTGKINIATLKEELFNWGEPLNELEFVDLPKIATKEKLLVFETGEFQYIKFIEKMNEKDTRFSPEPINFFKLDQKTLAAMAIQKAAEEKAEQERKEAEKKAREEAKRQRLIEQGLLQPDDPLPP